MADPLPDDPLEILLPDAGSDENNGALEQPAAMDADRRLELIGVVYSAAMEHLREIADLLARAQGIADQNEIVVEEQVLERSGLGDGLLERAARQGVKLVAIERAYVRAVLRVVGGNKSEAARRLGINRRTLQRRLGDGELDEDEQDEEETEADNDHPCVRTDHGPRGTQL